MQAQQWEFAAQSPEPTTDRGDLLAPWMPDSGSLLRRSRHRTPADSIRQPARSYVQRPRQCFTAVDARNPAARLQQRDRVYRQRSTPRKLPHANARSLAGSSQAIGQAFRGDHLLAVEQLGGRRLGRRLGSGNLFAKGLVAIRAESEPTRGNIERGSNARQRVYAGTPASLDEVDYGAAAARGVSDLCLRESRVVAKFFQAVRQTLPKRIFSTTSHAAAYTDGIDSQFSKIFAQSNSFA